jgi:transcriptional regulator with XRE-family HTH domain
MNKNYLVAKKEIGRRFRSFRKSLKKTQKDLGRELGMSQTNVARIEDSTISPTMAICYQLRNDHGLNIDWLLSGEGDMIPERNEKDYGEFAEEMEDLVYHLDRVPDVRQAVLKFFYDYKLQNKKQIVKWLEKYRKKKA